MKIFPWQKKIEFFTVDEKQRIIAALREAEQRTSGEVRVFVESRCRFVDALDRAAEIFFLLKMDMTEKRNASLVYIAMRDRQYAVFGDEGIHKAVGEEFWKNEAQKMCEHFSRESYADGICSIVKDIGIALHYHFPYDGDKDKNELPDEIVFGE